jgi:4-amino-4-deoxy-L-arabinose transferase-like glycosyltransferase
VIPPRLHAAVVAAAAALVLLTNLGGPALWDEDEPKNAACSLAMLERGDWVVPTFNGRLRVEKPALVNWVHLAGFAVAGRNETGARLGSAILTTLTCLLVWRIGRIGFGAHAGLLAGLAMATCVWTAVGGRSATPDAPLVFFTNLGLWCFVTGQRQAEGRLGPGWRSWRSACACGAALGGAVLAQGPLGLVMPLVAFLAFSGFAFFTAFAVVRSFVLIFNIASSRTVKPNDAAFGKLHTGTSVAACQPTGHLYWTLRGLCHRLS